MTSWRFLFLSLALHTLFWATLKYVGPYHFSNQDKNIEVQIIDNSSSMRIAHTDDTAKQVTLSKLKPRFLGEKDVRVENETKAKNLGYLNKHPRFKKQKEKNITDELFKTKIEKLGEDLNNEAASNISDFHDVREGAVTSLNTERFVYYSFFQRIDQQISNLWSQSLRNYQSRWTNIDIEKLGGKSWITQIEVLLDDQGNYVKTIIHRSSGVGPIDHAAIGSFQTAAVFPNPPRGLVAADGYVHLKYSFRYDVEPARHWARQ